MKSLSIGQMIAMLLAAPGLKSHERDFVLVAYEKSGAGKNTSLLNDKEVERVHSIFLEHAA